MGEITQSRETGIFFSYFQGDRMKDFPEALAGILDKENVAYYDAVYESTNGLYYMKPAPIKLLGKVLSPSMIKQIKRTGTSKELYTPLGELFMLPKR